ncbi:hypothetical protein RDWZM_005918 [Blomia tropicalis]|uniref:Brix domain-containing protein n=1 Tax=Blomia tropicalis TaxID=40697 RepID=A0A9Q0RNV8_BLOTA|nr:hypothetical protein BLOT_006653 [Blomia tropicalis]KAJ6220106.1 hypothetical protein RDWZM_005918 [Blomia tropicalis]
MSNSFSDMEDDGDSEQYYDDEDQDQENYAEEREDYSQKDDRSNVNKNGPQNKLLQNLNKLSKYKSKLHKEEIRKIKGKEKRERREKAKDEGLPKQTPKTIESTRVPNEDLVQPGDEEVEIDESLDEMSSYFKKEIEPKILITTDDNPHTKTIKFCRELRNTIPNSEFRFRKKASIKKMVKCATDLGYTDILIVNEDWRKPNALLHIHLPCGPTAYYRLSSIRYCKEIKNRAKYNKSRPEVIINNMTTRLGHSVGRMLASLFHFEPQFKGRKVVTFHNQRDYIFFRHHLYEFKNESKVAIRELGPRFTLKLRSLQRGTFDSKFGEYEWILKRHEHGINRRKFFL